MADVNPNSLMANRQALARMIRHVGPGVIEIKREADARPRMAVWGFFLALLIAFSVGSGGLKWVKVAYLYNFNYSAFIDLEVADYYERYPDAKITEDALRASMADDPGLTPGVIALVYGIPFAFIFLPLLFPRFTPVRFDGARQIAYTWHRGKLYIARFEGQQPDVNGVLQGRPAVNFLFERRGQTHLAAWLITLSPADGSRRPKRFLLGTLPAPVWHHYSYVEGAAREIIEHHGKDPDWLTDLDKTPFHWTDPLRAIFYATLFPGFRIDESKTEPAIAAYLAAQPTAN